MENTFIAQAYDAGDPGNRAGSQTRARSPVDFPYQAAYDMPFPGRAGYSAAGLQSFTPQYMGGLHPRAKQTIGRRLALAARAVAYGETGVPFTGPVLKNCTVGAENTQCAPGIPGSCHTGGNMNQRQITLNFDETLLGADVVRVWETQPQQNDRVIISMYDCINGTCLESCGHNTTCVELCAIRKTQPCLNGWAATPLGPSQNGDNPAQYDSSLYNFRTHDSVSPLEVQLNGTLWMPASISFNAVHSQGDPLNKNCKFDPRHPDVKPCVNWTKVDGWNSVVAMVPVSIPIGCGAGMSTEGYERQCPFPNTCVSALTFLFIHIAHTPMLSHNSTSIHTISVKRSLSLILCWG
eukprot:m.621907 g.621907  ORF g.621907 m.621907 type:complete len:351 (+) comp22538_c0_seq79:129-1181(+)